MPRQLDSELLNLGDLLRFVAQCPDDVQTRVVHEYLRDACQRLAMGTHRDYVQELKYAQRAAEGIGGVGLRKSVDRLIAELIELAQAA